MVTLNETTPWDQLFLSMKWRLNWETYAYFDPSQKGTLCTDASIVAARCPFSLYTLARMRMLFYTFKVGQQQLCELT
jgi:hypothetical protein